MEQVKGINVKRKQTQQNALCLGNEIVNVGVDERDAGGNTEKAFVYQSNQFGLYFEKYWVCSDFLIKEIMFSDC